MTSSWRKTCSVHSPVLTLSLSPLSRSRSPSPFSPSPLSLSPSLFLSLFHSLSLSLSVPLPLSLSFTLSLSLFHSLCLSDTARDGGKRGQRHRGREDVEVSSASSPFVNSRWSALDHIVRRSLWSESVPDERALKNRVPVRLAANLFETPASMARPHPWNFWIPCSASGEGAS